MGMATGALRLEMDREEREVKMLLLMLIMKRGIDEDGLEVI